MLSGSLVESLGFDAAALDEGDGGIAGGGQGIEWRTGRCSFLDRRRLVWGTRCGPFGDGCTDGSRRRSFSAGLRSRRLDRLRDRRCLDGSVDAMSVGIRYPFFKLVGTRQKGRRKIRSGEERLDLREFLLRSHELSAVRDVNRLVPFTDTREVFRTLPPSVCLDDLLRYSFLGCCNGGLGYGDRTGWPALGSLKLRSEVFGEGGLRSLRPSPLQIRLRLPEHMVQQRSHRTFRYRGVDMPAGELLQIDTMNVGDLLQVVDGQRSEVRIRIQLTLDLGSGYLLGAGCR
jgi:hypothetical protein